MYAWIVALTIRAAMAGFEARAVTVATAVPVLSDTLRAGTEKPSVFDAAPITWLEWSRKASVWMPCPDEAARSVNWIAPWAS